MAKKLEYLDPLMGREFYNFYKKIRRKPSKKIDQYNYFEKAIGGMIEEFRKMLSETKYGVHLKGLGVMYKRPFGQYMKKMSLFTHKRMHRKETHFYLEDDYLRNQYIITNTPNSKAETEKPEDKAEAILLHRKLKLKK